MYDPAGYIRKVSAKVDDTITFEADDINLPEYEFSFTVDLATGTHVLTIEAWDCVGHTLYKEREFEVTEDGQLPPPCVPAVSWQGALATVIILAGGTVWMLKRKVSSGT
jgi:hypothetical protein